MPEPVAFGDLLHLRAGVGDGDEPAAGLLAAHELLDAGEKVLAEDVRLERRPRLARDDEQGVLQIDGALEGLHLGRIGRIEHMKLRKPVDLPERRSDDFRAEARSAHAEEQDMREPGAPDRIAYTDQALDVRELVVRDAEPPKPLRFILAAPQGRIATPEPSDSRLRAPFRQ